MVGLSINHRRLSILSLIVLGLIGVLSASGMAAPQFNWASLSLSPVEIIDSPACGEAVIWHDTDNDVWACPLLHSTWEFWGEPLAVSSGVNNAPPECSLCIAALTVTIREPVSFTSIFTARDRAGEGQSIGYNPYPGRGNSFVATLFPSLESAIEKFVPSDVYTRTSPSLIKELQIANGFMGTIYLVPKWKVDFHIVAIYTWDYETDRSDDWLWKYDRMGYGVPYVTIEAIDWKFEEGMISNEDYPRRVSDAQN